VHLRGLSRYQSLPCIPSGLDSSWEVAAYAGRRSATPVMGAHEIAGADCTVSSKPPKNTLPVGKRHHRCMHIVTVLPVACCPTRAEMLSSSSARSTSYNMRSGAASSTAGADAGPRTAPALSGWSTSTTRSCIAGRPHLDRPHRGHVAAVLRDAVDSMAACGFGTLVSSGMGAARSSAWPMLTSGADGYSAAPR
jgi:hypothetical protein